MDPSRHMKQTDRAGNEPALLPDQPPVKPTDDWEWSKGVCPNCGYTDADVDSEGVLWCPACGYSKKGCYT
jgi:hypothetical protein